MSTAEEIVQALKGRWNRGSGMCRCPAHEDDNPSLSVEQQNGRVLVHCHAGCPQDAVLDALAAQGLDIRHSNDVNSDGHISDYRHPELGKPSHVWPYHDAAGKLIGYVARFETGDGKRFRPLVLKDGRWSAQGLPAPRPLFNLPTILQRLDAPVLVCEGEKAAEAASKRFPHVVATTSMHGAKSPHKTDWLPLESRHVTVWPDNDKAGATFARKAAKLAQDAGASSVRIVKLPAGLLEGWDLADDPPSGLDLGKVLADAPECETSDADSPDEQAVTRLAALSLLEYDRCRQEEADRLGVRMKTLDDAVEAARKEPKGNDGLQGRAIVWPETERWTEPVDGAALLTDLSSLIGRYVSMPVHAADAVALWSVATWLHEHLKVSTFLNVTSATKRCGKSLLFEVISELVHRPLPLSGSISPAVLFRMIEKYSPTLLLDEADTYFTDNPELRGVMNGSHRRKLALVGRCVGKDYEPRWFTTWCPKAISGIGNLHDTMIDRCVTVRLKRRPPGLVLPYWSERDKVAIEQLQRRIARWIDDETATILNENRRVNFPDGLHDRARDAWRILLAIGLVAGGEWAGLEGRAWRACQYISTDAEEETGAREKLLADLWKVFREAGDPEALPTQQILEDLAAMEGCPWSEWRQGKRLSPRGLASLLKPFKVEPKNIRFPGQGVVKGYDRAHLQPVWDAYLPKGGSVSATAATAENQKDLGDSLSATKPMVVADTKTCNPLKISDVAAVADREPLSPDQYEELEERAAIMEYDGGLTREEAERAAWESVGPSPPATLFARDTNDGERLAE